MRVDLLNDPRGLSLGFFVRGLGKNVKMSILKTENLKKYYGKEPNVVRALDGVSLEIEDGEIKI